jgi:hypothetical protein
LTPAPASGLSILAAGKPSSGDAPARLVAAGWLADPNAREDTINIVEFIERERHTVSGARHTGLVARGLGWVALSIGVATAVGTLVLFATGHINVEQFVLALAGTALTTTLAGTSAYVSGMSLDVNAARLELALDQAAKPEPDHGDTTPR